MKKDIISTSIILIGLILFFIPFFVPCDGIAYCEINNVPQYFPFYLFFPLGFFLVFIGIIFLLIIGEKDKTQKQKERKR